MVIGLFRISVSSWVSFNSLWLSRNLSILMLGAYRFMIATSSWWIDSFITIKCVFLQSQYWSKSLLSLTLVESFQLPVDYYMLVTFFPLFTFSLFESSNLKCIFCKEPIVESFFNPLCPFLLIRVFNSCIFNVITNKVGFIFANLILAFYKYYVFYVLLLLHYCFLLW